MSRTASEGVHHAAGCGGRAARCLAGLAGLLLVLAVSTGRSAEGTDGSAYDFTFTSIEGTELPLRSFAGRPILVVNTASRCGYTPQYRDLQTLWEDYGGRGLVVLGVPSNDFGGQEPGGAAEIKRFCELNYGIEFPMTDKQHVVGPDAHPFYRWAAESWGEAGRPRWNFHKDLVGSDGRLAGAWPSEVKPTASAIRRAVEAQLPSPGG